MSTNPQPSPDILFHRELVELGKYPNGKQNLELLPDYSRTLFEDVWARMNDRFSAQNSELRTRFGRELYFDFINSGTPNALAFSAGTFAMVGITRGMFDHLVLFSGRISTSPRFAKILGIPEIVAGARDSSIVTLFGMAVQFFTAHEIGHHVHGHVNFGAASGAPHLFELVDASDAANHVDLQAMEVDADAYAISSLLPNVLGVQFNNIAQGLGVGEKSLTPEMVLTLVLTAVACFLHTLPQRRYTPDTVLSLRHPPRLVRLNYILGNIQRWCRLYSAEVQNWPPLTQFQAVGQMVADCSGVSAEGMSWTEEDAFLVSTDGRRYIRDLDDGLSRVGEQMKPFAWQ